MAKLSQTTVSPERAAAGAKSASTRERRDIGRNWDAEGIEEEPDAQALA